MQVKINDWWFIYKLFLKLKCKDKSECNNIVIKHYKNELKKYLIGKTIKFNYGFEPPNNVGVIANIDFSGITPVFVFDGKFSMMIDFFDMYEYEII